MNRLLLLLALSSIFAGKISAQAKDSLYCDAEKIEVDSKVKGYKVLDGYVRIHLDSARKGFTIQVTDSSYRVRAFRLLLLCSDGDTIGMNIYGDSATPANCKLLNVLRTKDVLAVRCISLEKEKKMYRATSFAITTIN